MSADSPWKVLPGRYPRLGDVRELLRATDDFFVVSRPGDEIALSFEEPAELDHWLVIAEGIPSQGPLADGTPSLELGIAALVAVSGFHGLGVKLAAARRMLALQPDPASLWRQTASWALGYGLYLSGKKVEAQAAVEETFEATRRNPEGPRLYATVGDEFQIAYASLSDALVPTLMARLELPGHCDFRLRR